jgi:hypothetical protein
MLYNEPDFVNVKSLLKIRCKARGFRVIFFPKFHYELNFIEQCWGYSKQIYCELSMSSKEADLEQNVLAALESVPLQLIRRQDPILIYNLSSQILILLPQILYKIN